MNNWIYHIHIIKLLIYNLFDVLIHSIISDYLCILGSATRRYVEIMSNASEYQVWNCLINPFLNQFLQIIINIDIVIIRIVSFVFLFKTSLSLMNFECIFWINLHVFIYVCMLNIRFVFINYYYGVRTLNKFNKFNAKIFQSFHN